MAWEPTAYFYSRTGNPTNRALEEKIASLEGAEDCVVSASGMASVSATLFAHLGSGDHLVVGDELFAITTRAAGRGLPAARDRRDGRRHDRPRRRRGGDHAGDAAALPRVLDEPAPADRRPRRDRGDRPTATASPSSPTTRSSGRPCCARSSTAPTSSSTPRRSTSRATATRSRAWSPARKALIDPIRKQTDTFGQAASPFASFLVLRGVRTLPLRSAKGSANAARARGVPRGRSAGRVGALPGPRVASRPRGRDPVARATATGRW